MHTQHNGVELKVVQDDALRYAAAISYAAQFAADWKAEGAS